MQRALQQNSAFFCTFAVAACWFDAADEDEVYDKDFWLPHNKPAHNYWGVISVASNVQVLVNCLLSILAFDLYASPADIQRRLSLLALSPEAGFFKPGSKAKPATAKATVAATA